MDSLRILRVCIVMCLLLIQTAVSALPTPPIVILSLLSTRHACAGLGISLEHVLVLSSCIHRHGELTSATLYDKEGSVSFQATAQITSAVALSVETNSNTTTGLHVLTLSSPLSSESMVLPVKTPYPAFLSLDANASVISVNMNTMNISRVDGVVYVDNSRCDQTVCLLPVNVNDREISSQSNQWSFLIKYDSSSSQHKLLGFGSTPVTNSDGIWGFSWLPQVLTTSMFTDLGITGVHVVQTVNKEMGPPVSYTTDNTGFIVSLRAEQRDPSFCKIRWVVVTAINSSKERKAGEIIEVERTIRHPKYRVVRGKDQLMYNYDLLLVELRMSSVRTPIKIVNFNGLDVPQSIKQAKKATAFGLTLLNKAEVLRSVDLPHHYGKEKCNKLMQVKFTMPSDYVVCLGDKTTPKACLNDTASGGNPVILLPNTRTQRLLGVGSAGVACGYRKNYAMYTEISVNLQFIFQNVPVV